MHIPNLKIKFDLLQNLFSILLFFLILLPDSAFSAGLESELVKIPVNLGDSVSIIDAKIYKPQGDGPFPLIVLTHGTPRTAKDRQYTQVDTFFKTQCEFFVSKGYAVVFVVRRGFGNSNAKYAESPILPNKTRDYTSAGLEAAKDLSAAIDYVKTNSYIDHNKIILVGQSTGGHSVIATGSKEIPGVIGVINFAGGRGSYAPDLVRDENNLINSMAHYGKTSHIPTLWLYSVNDHYFRPTLAQAMYNAYTSNGGQAQFVELPAYGDDGHRSFIGNRSVWAPYVIKFLKENT